MTRINKPITAPAPAQAPYLRVVSSEGPDGEDEIFIYGYIGQEKWWDDDPTEPLTDLAVVKAIREADAKGRPFHIRINSPGGSVMHGEAIVSAIASARNTVHTHVDGIAASMAWDIWLRGHVRHFPDNGKAMIHTSSSATWGNAQDFRDSAEMLDKFDEASIAYMARVTGMPEDEIKTRFYDYKDHWLTARDLLDLGIITEIENANTDTRHIIQHPERLTYRQLLQQVRAIDIIPTEAPIEEPTDQKNWRHDYMQRLHILHEKSF